MATMIDDSKQNKSGNRTRRFLMQWTWLVALLLACAVIYERESAHYYTEWTKLDEQLTLLQQEKERREVEQRQLERLVYSQSDPWWVEMLLMQELGMVAEGTTKVLFKRKEKELQ